MALCKKVADHSQACKWLHAHFTIIRPIMKIALIGYGKMGHEIEKIALDRGHEVVCTIDIHEEKKFDSPAFSSADVAIEFTSPTVPCKTTGALLLPG